MTKQAAIDLMNSQIPALYTKEQVIELINKIETPQSAENQDQPSLKLAYFEKLVEAIEEEIKSRIERLDAEDFVDFSSAEMEMSDNEVSLVHVDFNTADVFDYCTYGVRNVIADYFVVDEN